MFTCSYIDSERFLRQISYRMAIRKNLIWIIISAALLIGVIGMYFFTWETWDLLVAVLGVVFSIKYVLGPGKEARKKIKELRERNGGELPVKTCIVEETGVSCTWGETRQEIQFEDVLAVYFLKEAILLETIDTTVTMANQGFGDTLEACKAHIRASCPNAPHYKG